MLLQNILYDLGGNVLSDQSFTGNNLNETV